MNLSQINSLFHFISRTSDVKLKPSLLTLKQVVSLKICYKEDLTRVSNDQKFIVNQNLI